jgi:hypothetical protein
MEPPGLAFGKQEDRLRAAVASVPLQACRLLALFGHGAMSALSPLCAQKRTPPCYPTILYARQLLLDTHKGYGEKLAIIGTAAYQ